MWRRLRTVVSHPVDACYVLGWMTTVEVAVRILPLPMVAAWMGSPLATVETTPSSWRPQLRPGEGRRLGLVCALGRRWPFGRGPCLRQALVAGRILRRHRPTLRIGAALEDADVVAHAWLEVGALELGRSAEFTTLVSGPPS
jgi:hypothetical protein